MAKSSGTTLAKPSPEKQPQPPAGFPDPTKAIRSLMEQSADRLALALPRHLSAERVTQVVTTLVYRTPKLQECDRGSILASVMRASSLGLDLEPAMNEAFLIPRWNDKTRSNECQFQIGYQGLRKLAMQSGQVVYLHSRLVRERDAFHYEFTPDLDFRHVPHAGADAGPVTHVYAVGKLASGDHVIEVMEAAEVESIHRRSDGFKAAARYQKAESGPWATDWNEMARKTVLKRLCKSLPRSLELAQAIDEDDDAYRAEGPSVTVSRAPRGISRADAMAAALEGPAEPEFTPGTSGKITTEADDDLPFGDELASPDQGQDADS